MFALLQRTWLHTQNGTVWNFKICLAPVHRFVSELTKCITLIWITIVQMWSYGFLEISHLAYNLKWVYWDCGGSGQNLEAPQWFIGTLSLSSQVSWILHFPLLSLSLSWLDCICPLWKSTMLRMKSAYGSHGLGLLPSPDKKYFSTSLDYWKTQYQWKILDDSRAKTPRWEPYLKVTFQDHVQSTYRSSTAIWPDLIIWHEWHTVPDSDAGRDKSFCSPCLPNQTHLFSIHSLCVTFVLQVLRPSL